MLGRDFFVGLEVFQVEDRLCLGRDGVGELQGIGDPPPVAGNLGTGDAAPLRVVVDGQRLFRGRLRGRQRVRGSNRNQDRESCRGDAIARTQGSRVMVRHVLRLLMMPDGVAG
jgi:hypothetical protein